MIGRALVKFIATRTDHHNQESEMISPNRMEYAKQLSSNKNPLSCTVCTIPWFGTNYVNSAKEHPVQENWFASSRKLGIHRRRKSTHLSASSLVNLLNRGDRPTTHKWSAQFKNFKMVMTNMYGYRTR